MKIRIAIPDNFIYNPLTENADKICKESDITLIRTSEQKCNELMLANSVNAALLTPLGYGLGLMKADYRIVPTIALSIEGFSQYVSIYFNQGMKKIAKVCTNSSRDYLMNIGEILLNERFGLESPIEISSLSIEENLKKYDACVNYGYNEINHSLDLTEEWFSAYEAPLPLAFWVVRNNEEPENIENIVKLFSNFNILDELMIAEKAEKTNYFREGKLILDLNEIVEDALDNTLQLLYFYQFFPEVPAVKILGKEII